QRGDLPIELPECSVLFHQHGDAIHGSGSGGKSSCDIGNLPAHKSPVPPRVLVNPLSHACQIAIKRASRSQTAALERKHQTALIQNVTKVKPGSYRYERAKAAITHAQVRRSHIIELQLRMVVGAGEAGRLRKSDLGILHQPRYRALQ